MINPKTVGKNKLKIHTVSDATTMADCDTAKPAKTKSAIDSRMNNLPRNNEGERVVHK